MNNNTLKIALITGGASGIGLAAATILAQDKHHVILADINHALAESEAKRLAEQGLHASAAALDVSDEPAWQQVIQDIQSVHGRLDVLVNNAGIAEGGNAESTTLDAFQRTMSINVNGVFLGCKYAMPLMEASGGGAIINTSSIFGIVADQMALAYCASKGAVRSLTKSVALDCAQRQNGIRVNSIHPGFVETPLVANAIGQLPEDMANDYVGRTVGLTPLARLGRPQEIGEAIAFLASDKSSFMNGSEMVIDGGFTAR